MSSWTAGNAVTSSYSSTPDRDAFASAPRSSSNPRRALEVPRARDQRMDLADPSRGLPPSEMAALRPGCRKGSSARSTMASAPSWAQRASRMPLTAKKSAGAASPRQLRAGSPLTISPMRWGSSTGAGWWPLAPASPWLSQVDPPGLEQRHPLGAAGEVEAGRVQQASEQRGPHPDCSAESGFSSSTRSRRGRRREAAGDRRRRGPRSSSRRPRPRPDRASRPRPAAAASARG